MAVTSPSPRRQAAGRFNALRAYRGDEDPATIDAGRQLAEARLADQIARTVQSAPPLSAEQRSRLAILLLGGGDAA